MWAWNMWNPCDAVAIIFFVIGLTLRFRPNTMDIGRVIYCVDSIYWYLRILNILGVNKYLGKNIVQPKWCVRTRFNWNFPNRSPSHNDGKNGEEYDLFRGAIASRIVKFRRQSAGYSIPKRRSHLAPDQRSLLSTVLHVVRRSVCRRYRSSLRRTSRPETLCDRYARA